MVSRFSLQAGIRGNSTPLWFDMIAVLIDTFIVIWAQTGLNIAWHNLPGGATPFRVHPVEWTVLSLGGTFWILVVIGLTMP